MNKLIKKYYENCFSKTVFDKSNEFQLFKNTILRKLLIEGKFLYKFFSFNQEKQLNKQKLNTLREEKIWCAPYYKFFDKTEFDIQFNAEKFNRSASTHMNAFDFIEAIKRISCLASFTYEYSDKMWNDYANKGNGFCVKYEMLNCDMFFPILYDEKKHYDFTEDLIRSFKAMQNAEKYRNIDFLNDPNFVRLGILPFVLKDLKEYGGEKELRLLYRVNFIEPKNNYYGSDVLLSDAGLKVSKLILDFDNCSFREELLNIAKENNYALEYRY